jgi:gliding motility-associated-like protein
VNVIDANCCVNADTTYVKVFKYFVPNAFSPNGDGLNDTFGVYALYTNITFKMTIFNRWGQLVFQADNINDVWDGTNGGVYCEPDSYVWLVNIGFQGQDIVTDGDVVLKGTVTLVR